MILFSGSWGDRSDAAFWEEVLAESQMHLAPLVTVQLVAWWISDWVRLSHWISNILVVKFIYAYSCCKLLIHRPNTNCINNKHHSNNQQLTLGLPWAIWETIVGTPIILVTGTTNPFTKAKVKFVLVFSIGIFLLPPWMPTWRGSRHSRTYGCPW